MKKLVAGCAFILLSVPAFAGTCVALDYQEMKDMSAEEVTVEACKVQKAAGEYLDQSIENIGGRGPKPYPNAQADFDQCMGQAARIERVLESKGVSKRSLPELCKQAAAKPAAP
jgi:hypothetical protein